MYCPAFSLIFEKAKQYGAWKRQEAIIMQLAKEEVERENVQSLKQASEYFSSMMRGAA